MTEDDVDSILNVEQQSFSIPWSRRAFSEELDNKLAIYLVAKIKNKVVGYVGMWKILDEGHITNIAILPEYRGIGIGVRLVEEILKEAEKEGINRVTLEVRKSNAVAQRLYAKFAFKIEGMRKGYYQNNGEDAVIMWKNIK